MCIFVPTIFCFLKGMFIFVTIFRENRILDMVPVKWLRRTVSAADVQINII